MQLRELTLQGARWRYQEITSELQARLDLELGIIGQKGFADYFLVVRDIVRHAPTHCGRGSVANSVVSYCLGIPHVEPLGAYSRKWKRIEDVPQGATVAIPNEPSNGGRALLLLQKAGLIRLKNPRNPLATIRDITSNPRDLKFKELEGATLPRTLGEVDLALINTNYALDAKLNPTRDALAIEDGDSPYVNFVVGRPGADSDPRVIKLIAALRSPAQSSESWSFGKRATTFSSWRDAAAGSLRLR